MGGADSRRLPLKKNTEVLMTQADTPASSEQPVFLLWSGYRNFAQLQQYFSNIQSTKVVT